ncbi:T9SS type A sorting domain-containing protein [Paracrocinitomix mangrovi]|uniref:T9SS type A sorting domain-containing protein n=1 Tax=Paracrocinitomix mangrovi TaxID=2862509 RepID=UPI001C8D6503|nr:T9SS type A sorting domain-containing protein [Paracrocinitomix mangrovi]UKN02245.1 T9SS type A sorting domain-containing protein [Paracrocinitomix mangrovi]
MRRLFTISCLIISLLTLTIKANGQQILSVSYSPEFPGLNDTIAVVYKLQFPDTACNQDSISTTELFQGQYWIESFTCCTTLGLGIIGELTDSVHIFPDFSSPGYLEVYFMSGFKTTTACPSFPYVNGDTIPYPAYIEYLQIPIGFAAGEIDFEKSEYDLKVFPNPFTDFTEINLEGIQLPVQLELFDQTGRLVRSEMIQNTNHLLKRGSLTAGVYYYTIGEIKGKLVVSD